MGGGVILHNDNSRAFIDRSRYRSQTKLYCLALHAGDLGLSHDWGFTTSAYDATRSAYWLITIYGEFETMKLWRLDQVFIKFGFTGPGAELVHKTERATRSFNGTYVTHTGTVIWAVNEGVYISPDGETLTLVLNGSEYTFWRITENTKRYQVYTGAYTESKWDPNVPAGKTWKTTDEGQTWDAVWSHDEFDFFLDNQLVDENDHIHWVYFCDETDRIYATLVDGSVLTIIRANGPVMETADWTALANQGPDGESIQMVPLITYNGYVYMGRDGGSQCAGIWKFVDTGTAEHLFLENCDTFVEVYNATLYEMQTGDYWFAANKVKNEHEHDMVVWGIRYTEPVKTYHLAQVGDTFYPLEYGKAHYATDYCKQDINGTFFQQLEVDTTRPANYTVYYDFALRSTVFSSASLYGTLSQGSSPESKSRTGV